MEELVVKVLMEVLMLVMVLVGGFVVQFLRKKIGVEKMKAIEAELAAKQEIVDTVVLFVQQVYEAYDGRDKYDKAVLTASEWITAKGFTVTPEELQSMIESSVKILKKEFAEQWWSATNEEAK